jgi:hypothetical protein
VAQHNEEMTARLEVALLGPVEVRLDGAVVAPAGVTQRVPQATPRRRVRTSSSSAGRERRLRSPTLNPVPRYGVSVAPEGARVIEFMEESEGDVLGVRARGMLTSGDYRQVLAPRLESLVQRSGP